MLLWLQLLTEVACIELARRPLGALGAQAQAPPKFVPLPLPAIDSARPQPPTHHAHHAGSHPLLEPPGEEEQPWTAVEASRKHVAARPRLHQRLTLDVSIQARWRRASTSGQTPRVLCARGIIFTAVTDIPILHDALATAFAAIQGEHGSQVEKTALMVGGTVAVRRSAELKALEEEAVVPAPDELTAAEGYNVVLRKQLQQALHDSAKLAEEVAILSSQLKKAQDKPL